MCFNHCLGKILNSKLTDRRTDKPTDKPTDKMEKQTKRPTCPFLLTPMIPLLASWTAVTKIVSPLMRFM